MKKVWVLYYNLGHSCVEIHGVFNKRKDADEATIKLMNEMRSNSSNYQGFFCKEVDFFD